MIPNYLLVSSLHLTGTRWAMLLPFCISQFNLIIMINSFKSLPHELEEAALIDGLGYWGILRRIIVPLSTAAIATVGLYYAVFFWNDWFNSLIYLNKEQYPVMLFLRNIVNGTAMVGDGAGSADKSSWVLPSSLPLSLFPPCPSSSCIPSCKNTSSRALLSAASRVNARRTAGRALHLPNARNCLW